MLLKSICLISLIGVRTGRVIVYTDILGTDKKPSSGWFSDRAYQKFDLGPGAGGGSSSSNQNLFSVGESSLYLISPALSSELYVILLDLHNNAMRSVLSPHFMDEETEKAFESTTFVVELVPKSKSFGL